MGGPSEFDALRLSQHLRQNRCGQCPRIASGGDETYRTPRPGNIRLAHTQIAHPCRAQAARPLAAESADIEGIRGQRTLQDLRLPVVIVEEQDDCRPWIDRNIRHRRACKGGHDGAGPEEALRVWRECLDGPARAPHEGCESGSFRAAPEYQKPQIGRQAKVEPVALLPG
ncbi:hypothetical protein CDV50_15175 [Haematobacter massiliensis]|nr:hypothetical protein CDV50_15175 [Haematobacter massiliensis]